MEIVTKLVFGIHIIVSILLVITVLLQPGKGGDLGSMFGGGTSESIFGASGAVPFLTKVTRILAVIFMVTSLSLGYFSAKGISSSVITDSPSVPVEQEPVGPSEKGAESTSQTDNPSKTEAVQESAPSEVEQSQPESQKPDEKSTTEGTKQ
ncbi:MAG TPA: preprotein translocase subunit SecG [Thermodesulfobacteriota bacterium]|nr:preprotein translocase subunit SecG [Thermodesulfobacteriota bacterium]